MKVLQLVSKPFLSNPVLDESLLASRSKISTRNSRRNVIGLTQKANDTRNIIHATPGFEPGELLTLPTRHRYNSLQAWPLLPSTAFPLRLRQSQRKLGIVVPKLCVTTTIVRQDWAKLMKTRAGSTKKGWRKGWDLPRNRYSNCWRKEGVRLIVTNTDPGLPNYKLMSRGNFARNNFLLLYLISHPTARSTFKRRVYPTSAVLNFIQTLIYLHY